MMMMLLHNNDNDNRYYVIFNYLQNELRCEIKSILPVRDRKFQNVRIRIVYFPTIGK